MDLKNIGASILGNVIGNAMKNGKGGDEGALSQVTSMLQGVDLGSAISKVTELTSGSGKDAGSLLDFLSALKGWQGDKSAGAENRLLDLTSKFSMSDIASTVNNLKGVLPSSLTSIINTLLPILGSLKK